MAKKPARRRLPADKAQAQILDVASNLLTSGGVSAVTLAAVAREIGVSHQAIGHHFRTRAALLEALTTRALDGLYRSMMERLRSSNISDPEQVLKDVDQVLSVERHGRSLAWLILSESEVPEGYFDGPLVPVLKALRGLAQAKGGEDAERAAFTLELVLLAALGRAVFGPRLKETLGLDDPEHDAKQRQWFAELLAQGLYGPKFAEIKESE